MEKTPVLKKKQISDITYPENLILGPKIIWKNLTALAENPIRCELSKN